MADTTASWGLIFQPIVQFLFGAIINKIEKLKESKVTCIVIPAGSGKSTFLQSYLAEFNSINSDLYLVDIESEALKDIDEAGQKEMDLLKQKDVLIYQSKLFLLCEDYLKSIILHLKKTKIKKNIVVLVSSNELKKFLKVKKAFYYAPAKKLYEKIKAANPYISVYLDYTRQLLQDKNKTKIYTSYDELYTTILSDLKITRTI